MGALQGTLSYKLYYVDGDVPRGFTLELVERITPRAFEPLTPDCEEDERVGWVVLDRPLQTDRDSFDVHSVVYGQFVNLGLRVDTYSIPSALMKAHLQQAERSYQEENGKARISKFEKDDLKSMVRRSLKERIVPRMKVYDLSWDTHAGRVRFWSQSNRIGELFQGLFEDTFGLRLLPASPYITATRLSLGQEQVARLAEVEPCTFATRPQVG